MIGALGNEAVALYRIRVGRRIGSAALVADGLHARTDALTSLAVLAGAAGVALGWQWADPAVGLVIAGRHPRRPRPGRARAWGSGCSTASTPPSSTRARTAAASVAGVQEVGEVRARWIGHRLQADVRLTVDRDLDVATAHDIADEVERALLAAVPVIEAAVVHVDPCSHEVSHV